MEITEVRIKLMNDPQERLQAFCSITLDYCFVIRDLKIIEGTKGSFVAMPSRKLTSHCPKCRTKNHLRSQHCNQCGAKLDPNRMATDSDGRAKLYADIAHPINSACREMIQESVIQEFHEETKRSQEPNYVSRYDDFDLDYEEPSPTTPSKRTTESRVDPAHEKHGQHVPRSGGSAEQASSDRTGPLPHSAAEPSRSREAGGFGSGVFPDE